jgi:uncharacterized protein
MPEEYRTLSPQEISELADRVERLESVILFMYNGMDIERVPAEIRDAVKRMRIWHGFDY